MSWLVITPITCGPYMQPFWASSTGVAGMGHCLSGTPDLTHTNTFLRVPFPLTTTSSDFCGAPACARASGRGRHIDGLLRWLGTGKTDFSGDGGGGGFVDG